jgi:hypothetical protein
VDGEGGVYVASHFFSEVNFAEDWGETDTKVCDGDNPAACDISVTKMTEQGEYCWTRSIGGTDIDSAVDICATPNGNVFLTGFFYGAVNFAKDWEGFDIKVSNGGFDIFITKLSQE